MSTTLDKTTTLFEDVVIPALNIQRMTVEVESWPDSSLIINRFGAKAKRQLIDKHEKKTKVAHKKRTPKKEYEDAKHLLPDGQLAFPASGFFKGILDAAIEMTNVTKTGLRRAIYIVGDQGTDLVAIHGDLVKPVWDDPDYVRLAGVGRTVDLRYRPYIENWTAMLNIDYNADKISIEQITNLLQHAGYESGIGDWRRSAPFSPGVHGMYRVKGQ